MISSPTTVGGTPLTSARRSSVTRRFLAVDLGGTTMRAAIVDEDGTLLQRSRAPTPDDPEADALMELVEEVLHGDVVEHAVIGVPGWVDYADGALERAPNLPAGWTEDLTAERIGTRIGLPVDLANDADLAAVGEAYFGAARGASDVAYITISTGIGAGVVLGGQRVGGRRPLGEIGHTIIDWEAGENEPATLEALGSGTSLARRAAAVGLPRDGRGIVELVHAGDERAREIWDQMVRAVQVGATNLAWAFMPEVVVLGGGVGLNGDLLIDPVREHLRDHGPSRLDPPISVHVAALGDDAGLVGAAAWRDATRGRTHMERARGPEGFRTTPGAGRGADR